MKKLTASSLLILLTLSFLPFKANAANVSPARETSISRMMVSLFKARSSNRALNELWLRRRRDIQQTLVTMLNAKSSIEAVPSKREYGLDARPEQIISETQADGGDGALVGEFQGQSLEISVRSGSTARSLMQLSVPVIDLARENARNIAQPAVDALTAAFRYVGFVVATHGNEAKINVGRNQGVTVGSRMTVFEFEGDQPTFQSRVRRVGELRVTKVTNYAALAEITQTYSPVLPYAKIAFAPPPRPQQPIAEQPAPVPSPAQQYQQQYQQPTQAREQQPPPQNYRSTENGGESSFYRVSPGASAYFGVDLFAIDTEVGGSTSVSAQKRVFQVPLSPAFTLGIGYGRFQLDAMYSSLSNTSNTVGFLQGAATYQVYTAGSKSMSMLTSVGLYYSAYNVTPSANPTTILISTTTIAPTVEERFKWTLSPKSHFFVAPSLYFPVMASDAENGSSVVSKSFGGGLDLGYHYGFNKNLGVIFGGRMHYFTTGTSNTAATISETEYSLYTRFMLMF